MNLRHCSNSIVEIFIFEKWGLRVFWVLIPLSSVDWRDHSAVSQSRHAARGVGLTRPYASRQFWWVPHQREIKELTHSEISWDLFKWFCWLERPCLILILMARKMLPDSFGWRNVAWFWRLKNVGCERLNKNWAIVKLVVVTVAFSNCKERHWVPTKGGFDEW